MAWRDYFCCVLASVSTVLKADAQVDSSLRFGSGQMIGQMIDWLIGSPQDLLVELPYGSLTDSSDE